MYHNLSKNLAVVEHLHFFQLWPITHKSVINIHVHFVPVCVCVFVCV